MKTGTWSVVYGAVPGRSGLARTAVEVAERADVAVGTARRYLAEMVKRGRVSVIVVGRKRLYYDPTKPADWDRVQRESATRRRLRDEAIAVRDEEAGR